MQFPKIKSVKALDNYMLNVVFADGTERNYDIGKLAGKGVFKSWDADRNFYKVFINPVS